MLRRRLRRDDGVSSIELAIIAPSLLFLIFLVIQVALYLYGRSVALQAAREGVTQLRLDRTQQSYDVDMQTVPDHVEQFADSIGRGALDDPAMTAVYRGDAGTVTATVTGKSITLIPFVGAFSISESATGQIERFQDEG